MPECLIQVEVENLSDIKRKLAIVVAREEVAQEVNRAYRDLGKRVKVKGFRPGKTPRSVLELYYGKQVQQEVSDNLVRRCLGEALKEKALEPVGVNWPEPLPKVITGEEYRFTVELEVTPKFTVENYTNLTLEDPGVEVTDDMVNQRLEEIRQSNAMLQPLTESREVQEGDFVVLSYQGYFAGQALDEGRADNTFMEVGAGKFNLDFERQLIGLAPESETRFAVSLPNDFFNPLLAGKVVEFQVKVHDIKVKVTPDLNDDFAQSLGGNFQSLADLRTAVREDIIKTKETERQSRLEQQVLDQLLAATTFEVPPSLISREQENMLREQLHWMEQQGINLEGLDFNKMLESVRPRAERRVRARLLLDRLAAQENLSLDKAEIDANLARLAEKRGQTIEQVRQHCQEQQVLEALTRQWRDDKIMKYIIDQADLVPSAAKPTEETA